MADQTRSAATRVERARFWRDRKLAFEVHGRGQGSLILAARMFRPGSLLNRAFYRAADLYWFHFHFKQRWGSGY